LTSVEVLAVTMNQTDVSLVATMNIAGDAVFGNQCGLNDEWLTEGVNGGQVTYWCHDTVGVGLNRNAVLERATAEICLLADDDMVFVDGYEQRARDAFAAYDADVLIFNLDEDIPLRTRTEEAHRVRFWNYMRFGAARVGFRREAMAASGIRFSTKFGGGAPYGAGEDTLFLRDCLRRGLVIWAVPVVLARLTAKRDSSWFRGYDAKYFADKGALYAAVEPKLWPLLALQFAVRHRGLFREQISVRQALVEMSRGASAYRRAR
jgi:glycosyltransferase involved in cell wall biosynthesis